MKSNLDNKYKYSPSPYSRYGNTNPPAIIQKLNNGGLTLCAMQEDRIVKSTDPIDKPLIQQAYRAIQSSLQADSAMQSNNKESEILPAQLVTELLLLPKHDITKNLQMIALEYSFVKCNKYHDSENSDIARASLERYQKPDERLSKAYSDLTTRLPRQIIDEDRMKTLLSIPTDKRIAELQINALELGTSEPLKSTVRTLFNKIIERTNVLYLDVDTINPLLEQTESNRLASLILISMRCHDSNTVMNTQST